MKKLLALATAFLLTPFSTLAISLADIRNNPDQYVLVTRESNYNIYVDSYSIASLRYDPPYFAMSGKVYIVIYNMDAILKSTATTTYDGHRSLKHLFLEERKTHPSTSANDLYILALDDMQKNSGLTFHCGPADVWNLDGNYQGSMTSDQMNSLTTNAKTNELSCELASSAYQIANYFFYKGYNLYFGPKFDSENLY